MTLAFSTHRFSLSNASGLFREGGSTSKAGVARFWWSLVKASRTAKHWALNTDPFKRMLGPRATLMESVSVSLVWEETCA